MCVLECVCVCALLCYETTDFLTHTKDYHHGLLCQVFKVFVVLIGQGHALIGSFCDKGIESHALIGSLREGWWKVGMD